jgi:histidinol-phosphate aminotransferase
MQFAQVFAGPGDDIVASQYGFAVYALATQAAGATLRQAPAFPPGHAMARGHDLDAITAALTPRTRIVYLANPNNPTGTWFGRAAFAAFIARVPDDVLVVVDEAYAEYGEADGSGEGYASALQWLPSHRNLIVTRTFSKAYALAGLRLGYAIANSGLVAVMERVRESFNVNSMGLAAAQAVLDDQDHLRWSLARNAEQRALLADALRARGWFVHPSLANFLLVEFGERTQAIEAALLAQGVVVRPMSGYGLPGCLRITVGEAGENRRLLAALDAP